MSEIAIVIVTYNSESEIGACLDAAVGTGAEVVVVDNASGDGTVAQIARRGVKLIANPSNRGFAAAVNQGLTATMCEYVLLLNPDAVLATGLEALRRACDEPRTAGAGGLLLDENGQPQIGFMVRRLPTPAALILEVLVLNRIWPNNPVNRRYRGLGLDYSATTEVEQPAGAFVMIRRAVWQELGGFDEGYFPLWFEDVDFFRRAVDRGHHSYLVPEVVAKHTGGHSLGKIPVEMHRLYWYRNLLRYAARHFGPMAFRAVSLAVVTGSFLRMTAESTLHGSLKPLAVYGRVVRFAGRCCVFGWRDEAV